MIDKEEQAYEKSRKEDVPDSISDTPDLEVKEITSLALVATMNTQSADTTKPNEVIITSSAIDTSEYNDTSQHEMNEPLLDEYESVIEDLTKNQNELDLEED